MKKYFVYLMLLIILLGCSANAKKADAYGNFEADEIVLSSESNGKIIISETGLLLSKVNI